jgi:hypothetical protein
MAFVQNFHFDISLATPTDKPMKLECDILWARITNMAMMMSIQVT